MSLVNELIKNLLPEAEKKQTVALYAGGFKPPTSGHFEVAKLALEQNPEIDKLILFVGKKDRDGVSQVDSVIIWEIYKKYLPFTIDSEKIKIVPSSVPPIKAVYNYAKENPNQEVLWVIGAREGNEEDFEDIKNRTTGITKYPNLELRTIITKGGVSGTAARKASKYSFDQFKEFLPNQLTDEERKEIYDIVSNKIQEVGEANLPPYEWEETRRGNWFINYEFKTDSGEKYLVKNVKVIDGDEFDWEINFYVDISAEKEEDEDDVPVWSSSIVVNQGEIYRVMSTITDIIKNLIKEFPDSRKLSFTPSLSKIGNIDNQRGELYKAYVRKQIPQAKISENGEEIIITLPRKISNLEEKKDPKKGTGKKPKGSGRRLYTDEDPKDTVGVKFSSRQDIVDTLNKASFKSKSHARQSQIINLIHQRTRAAYNRAKDPAVKKRLKAGLDYITKRKEASKKKTQRLKKQKLNEFVKSDFNRVLFYQNYFTNVSPSTFNIDVVEEDIVISGINNPYPPEFNNSTNIRQTPVNQNLEEGDTIEKYSAKGKATGKLKQGTVRKRLNIPKDKKIPLSLINKELARLRKMDKDPDKKGAQLGDKNQKYYKALQLAKTLKTTTNVNEAIDPSKFNFTPHITSLTKHMIDNGLKLEPLPQINMVHDDYKNGEDLFGKTAYYSPSENEIVLFTYGRHPKDILRSYAHELIHVHQNMENRLQNISTTDVNEDDYLEQLEREAYETGNILFRSWTDSLTGNKLNENKKGDPFGLKAYAQELARLREDEENEYMIYLDMDGVIADFKTRFKNISGRDKDEYIEKEGRDAFWNFINTGKNKIRFWVGIPPMEGAKKLVDYVSKYDYEILTSPSRESKDSFKFNKNAMIGKSGWVKKYIGDIFPSKPKINFRFSSNKHTIKTPLTKKDILIDDTPFIINNWNNAGGTGILYKSSDQVISDLKKLGL